MNRVMIIGGSGAGKSTFARRLGHASGLPVVHLDAINWSSGWVMRPDEERFGMARDATVESRWIIEGNYSKTFPERIARSDTIIMLDIPTLTRRWRVGLRMIKYRGQTRPDLADNCPERFDLSFFPWVWSYSSRGGRGRALTVLENNQDQKTCIRLTSNRQIKAYLASIQRP